MEPAAEVSKRIDDVGQSLAQALGAGAVCIAVYGSAAGDDFSPGHSDVNLLIVLRDVTFADLRLIGATLEREATDALIFATPLVIAPSFLTDARDSFPIELADIAARHRVLQGDDLLASVRVSPAHIREEAEREARSKLLHLRALVMHRPPEAEMRHALAGLVSTISLLERALLEKKAAGAELRGAALFAEIQRLQGITLGSLNRLHAMREERESWPSGDALDELVEGALRDVEALVAWVDTHAHDSVG
ncbi:MAG: hypothetical protein P8R42_16470 [Candidatus Binatia bacterium]|nr:hypothetical protein [Candidatus Binatia bacterium]